MTARSFRFAALLLVVISRLICSAATAQEPAALEADTEGKAAEILRAFGEYHAGLNGIELKAELTLSRSVANVPFDYVTILDFSAQKPNRVLYQVKSQDHMKDLAALVCDGTILSAYAVSRSNKYASIDAPSSWRFITRDRMARSILKTTPVLFALLQKDPAASILKNARSTKYRGIVTLGDHKCHLIEVAGSESDRRLWIDAGERPLLRRVDEDNTPTWTNMPRDLIEGEDIEPLIRKTTLIVLECRIAPEFPKDHFVFRPPADLSKADSLRSVLDPEKEWGDGPVIDSKSRRILEAAEEYLCGLKGFRATAVEENTSGENELTSIELERPGRLAMRHENAQGLDWKITNGRQRAVFIRDGKYLVSTAPNSIHDFQSRLSFPYMLPNQPLELLLKVLTGEDLLEDLCQGGRLEAIKYIGEFEIQGHKCHLLEGASKRGDRVWRFAIDGGDSPVLREVKRSIDREKRKNRETVEWESVMISKWAANPRFDDNIFETEIPGDAQVFTSVRNLLNSEHSPLLNVAAPDVTLSVLDGKETPLKSFKDANHVILDFWQDLSSVAQRRASVVSRIAQRHQKNGVKGFAISYYNESPTLRDFVREGNVQIPVAIDHARAIDDAFGVGPFDPTTIIIDSNGQVRYVMEGFPLDLEEQIERALKSLTQPQDANR